MPRTFEYISIHLNPSLFSQTKRKGNENKNEYKLHRTLNANQSANEYKSHRTPNSSQSALSKF